MVVEDWIQPESISRPLDSGLEFLLRFCSRALLVPERTVNEGLEDD
jgi:hypothetical protein